MKTKLYQAFVVFVLVFCAPWAIVNALNTYKTTGESLGQWIYETTHENS